jgi:hypothetical protein
VAPAGPRVARPTYAFAVGGRYYQDKPAGGPDWGLHFAIILLFLK